MGQVSTSTTPGIAFASAVRTSRTTAWGTRLRTKTPWSMRGSCTSKESRARPVTLSGASTRSTARSSFHTCPPGGDARSPAHAAATASRSAG